LHVDRRVDHDVAGLARRRDAQLDRRRTPPVGDPALGRPLVERHDQGLAGRLDDTQQPVPPPTTDDETGRVRLAVPPVAVELEHLDAGQVRDCTGQTLAGQRVAQVRGQRLVLTPGRCTHPPMMRPPPPAAAAPRP